MRMRTAATGGAAHFHWPGYRSKVSKTIQRLAKRETTNQTPLGPQPREGTNCRGGSAALFLWRFHETLQRLPIELSETAI